MSKNQSKLYDLAAKALFLRERIEGKSIDFSMDYHRDQIEERYKLWQEKVGGNGRKITFNKRLTLDNLTLEAAKRIVSDVKWNSDCQLPWWIKDIEKILNILSVEYKKIEKDTCFYKNKKNANRLYKRIFLPLIYHGEKKLIEELKNKNIFLKDTVLIDMSFLLMIKIEKISLQVLNYKFQEYLENTTKKSFVYYMLHGSKEELDEYWNEFTLNFLSGGWKDIFLEFPVLGRLIVIEIENWKNSLVEMMVFLEKDRKELEKAFNNKKPLGELIKINGGLSDGHNRGRCVYILEFSKRIKIVYKPRALDIDQVWNQFIGKLETEGLQCNIKAPKVLTYRNYGWMEYLDRTPLENEEEIEKFYYRSGAVLAIIYALGGTDFHAENIVAWGSQLALIDNETLLSYNISHQGIGYDETSVEGKAFNIIKNSVLNTCLLTFWCERMDNKYVDLGGITSNEAECKNSPIYKEELVNPLDYKKEIIEGFEYAYNFIMKNKGLFIDKNSILDGFKNCKFRFVIRNSQLYSDMLKHITKPEYLRDGLYYSFEIERLATGFMLVAKDESEERLWKIFKSEREALERGDIPIFYGRGIDKVLMDSENVLYEDYFMESMIDRSKYIIRGMDENDKKNQIEYIDYSISMKKWNEHLINDDLDYISNIKIEDIKEVEKERFVEEAEKIYNNILEKSISNENGNFTWITGKYNFKLEKMEIDQMGLNLYDGILGPAIFMSAFYDLTEKEEIKKKTLLLLENFRKQLYDDYNPLSINRFELGLGNGLAGIIKSLIIIGRYLKEEDFKKDALYIAKKINKNKIRKDKAFDVLTGSAGLILSLAELYNIYKDEKIFELLEACGDNLLKNGIKNKEGYITWKTESNHLQGFGCGTAGIASALSSLYPITGNEELNDMIDELYQWESSLYLNKNDKKLVAGWCNGLSGLGFSKLDRETFKKEDIDIILSNILESPMYYNDNLCCGNSGIIDFLLEASFKLDNSMIFEEAQKRMMWVILKKQEKGFYNFNGSNYETIISPSFFKGLSGIGYEILRCIAPQRYVSLLY